MTSNLKERVSIKFEEIKKIVGTGWTDKFGKWAKQNQIKGLSSGSIRNLKIGSYDNGTRSDYPDKSHNDKLILFLKHADSFLAYVSANEGKHFLNTIWNVYFYTTIPPNHKFVELGRGSLKITTLKDVEFKFLFNKAINTKKGEISFISTTSISLDLYSIENKENHIHIKINKRINPTDIMLGGYINSESGTITMGNLLFEQHKSEELLEPIYLSPKKGGNEKAFFDLNKVIRKYLSRKSDNFLKVPNRIFDTETLNDKINEYRKTRHFNTSFYEHDKPIIYIATPHTNSSKKEEYFTKTKKVIDTLKNKYTDPSGNCIITIKFFALDGKFKYKDIVDYLKYTSFFVLIFYDKVASTSLMELGLAFAYSKKIMIFSKMKYIPYKIRSIANKEEGAVFYADLKPETIIHELMESINEYLNEADELPPA